MIVKAIFTSSYYSSLYTAFAASVCRGLNTALAAAECIRIIIGGIIVTIVVIFIHQSGSLSNSNLNFTLTIQSILLSPLMVEIICKIVNSFSFQPEGSLILFKLK